MKTSLQNIALRIAATAAVILTGSGALTGGSQNPAQKELLNKYRKKFVVVLKQGLAVGICSSRSGSAGNYGGIAFAFPYLSITISGDQTNLQDFNSRNIDTTCGRVMQEPVHPGEVLKVAKVSVHGEELSLQLETVNAHSVQRGIGAFAHESLENGTATLNFSAPKSGDLSAIIPTVDAWLKPFDDGQDAAKFGNTASLVFVKEIKLGMTFAEVEQVLGPPQTKIDLGPKVLYKYQNMTVEFHDGRVADVK